MKHLIMAIFFIMASSSSIWSQTPENIDAKTENRVVSPPLTEAELKTFCAHHRNIFQLETEEERIKVMGFDDDRIGYIYGLCYNFWALEHGGSNDELGITKNDLEVLQKYKDCVLRVGRSN